MKNLIVVILLSLSVVTASAQADSLQLPPYQRYPKSIPLKLLLTDSSTYFTKENLAKKKPVLIMLFSPDCSHCQHETEEMIKHIEALKNVQIVMATTQPFPMMKEFYIKYGLDRFKNIIVGREENFTLPVYYDIRNYPFFAFYNRKKELITGIEGSVGIDKIMATFGKEL